MIKKIKLAFVLSFLVFSVNAGCNQQDNISWSQSGPSSINPSSSGTPNANPYNDFNTTVQYSGAGPSSRSINSNSYSQSDTRPMGSCSCPSVNPQFTVCSTRQSSNPFTCSNGVTVTCSYPSCPSNVYLVPYAAYQGLFYYKNYNNGYYNTYHHTKGGRR